MGPTCISAVYLALFLLHTPKQYIKRPPGRPSDVISANRKCVSLSIKEEVEELKHLDKGTSLKSLCEKYDGLSTICYLKGGGGIFEFFICWC